MFLHGEDIAPITNTVQMQKSKNAKFSCIQLIYNMISYFCLCKTFAFLCKKGRKGCFWGVVFALKCPIERTNPTETRWVFVFLVFGYMSSWTKFMLKVRVANSQWFQVACWSVPLPERGLWIHFLKIAVGLPFLHFCVFANENEKGDSGTPY